MQTATLSDVMGVEVRGLDPSVPLGEQEVAELRDLYARHHMVLVRGYALTRDQYARYVGYFWPPAVTESGSPKWTAVSNVDERDGTGQGVLLFHQDEAFSDKPALALSLYANQVSKTSAPTSYASAVGAARRMPTMLRERLQGLTARHLTDFRCTDGDSTYRVRECEVPEGASLERYPRADHPVFLPIRKGGDVALFVSEHQTSHINGMPLEKSEELLQQCFRVLYNEDNEYVHQWQPHDVLIWNNLALQHGRPSKVGKEPRDFWRLKTY
jgi:alpha-ketoglutarate-dependent taurine dioxygenase